MTPADKATFIALWQQGLETAAIAELMTSRRIYVNTY
jgi:hypothetical protein